MNSEMEKPTVLPENDNIEEAATADATVVENTVTDGIEAEEAPVNEEASEAAEAEVKDAKDEEVTDASEVADDEVAEVAEVTDVEGAEAVEAEDEPVSEVTDDTTDDAADNTVDEAITDEEAADEAADDTEAKESEDDSPALTDDDTADAKDDDTVAEDEAALEAADKAVEEKTEEKIEEKTEPVHHAVHLPREEKKKPKKENGTRRVDALFDFIELFVFTLAAVLFITSFFVRHSVVDGDSMLGTLHDGENLLISDLFYTPERGDIIVVDDHSTLLKKPIIKRVIAVGGDVVRITRHGVFVNGEPLVEDYVFTDEVGYTYEVYPSAALMENDTLVIKAGEYYELTVPDGELFVMGDHRNKSTDSREIGTVDEDAVLGRVILRFYPFDKFGEIE